MDYAFRNNFNLIGNISSINEIKEQSNGTKYRYFGLAQNNKYKNKNGQDVNDTSFFNIKIYEKDFNKFEPLLEVGKYVYVQGFLNNYQDSDNKTVEVKIGKEIRDLSKGNKLPDKVRELMEELEDYDWLEDSSEDMEI